MLEKFIKFVNLDGKVAIVIRVFGIFELQSRWYILYIILDHSKFLYPNSLVFYIYYKTQVNLCFIYYIVLSVIHVTQPPRPH